MVVQASYAARLEPNFSRRGRVPVFYVTAPRTPHLMLRLDARCCAPDLFKKTAAMMRPDAKVEKVYLYPKPGRCSIRCYSSFSTNPAIW